MLGRRYADFDVLMQWIHALRDTWWPGPTFTHRDLYPAEGRNVITTGALLDKKWDDLVWIDSDHMVAMKFMDRLAEYPPEVELVIGTYFGREYPFDLQAWDSKPDQEGLLAIDPRRVDEMLKRPGLHRVGGGGTGFMFMRRAVLERMQGEKGIGYIWEIKGLSPELAEKLGAGIVLGEDVVFCIETKRRLGVQAFLDTDHRVKSGHMQTRPVDERDWRAAHMAGVVFDTHAVEEALRGSGHRLELDVVPKTPTGHTAAAGDTRRRRRLLGALRRVK